MTKPINLAIATPTLERLLRNQQITLDEIHCQDSVAHHNVQDMLLKVLKSQLNELP